MFLPCGMVYFLFIFSTEHGCFKDPKHEEDGVEAAWEDSELKELEPKKADTTFQ